MTEPTNRRLTMVWKLTPPGGRQVLEQVLDLLRTMASWCWVDPALSAGPPEGWTLQFSAAMSTDGYLVLNLWPEAPAHDG